MSSSSSASGSASSGSNSSASNNDDSSSSDESERLNHLSQREFSQSDDLVSVTVRKMSPTQKAGVSLVERQSNVFVTKVTENGLFHGTQIEVGDVVLSINGKRLRKGQGAKDIINHISKAKTTVTMVVKKSNRKARRGVRSLSPTAQRRKKNSGKIHRKSFSRNADGSLKYDINPRLDNIQLIDPNDDKPQIPISANKIFPAQDIGLRFKDIENMIFVSAVATDSIFRETDLELGDRIVGVSGMNFMSYGDSKYAMQVLAKATKEVSLVVEKDHTVFDKKRDTDPAHETAWIGTSSHEKKLHPKSPKTKASSNTGGDSDEDNLVRLLERSGHFSTGSSSPRGVTKPGASKKLRKAKAGTARKNPPVKGKVPAKKSKVNSGKDSPRKLMPSPGSNDSDESSLGDFAEEEQSSKMTSPLGATKSRNVHSLSKLNQSLNLGRSLTFDYDNFDGDFIKVTIRKDSEARPGIAVEKTEGKFLLTAVPQHEKRVYPGMQILAINGIVNLHTVTKAEDIINRCKGEVEMIVDFPHPLMSTSKCPCCSRQITPDGKHVTGSSNRRIIRRKVEPNDGGAAEAMSVAASENTTRMNNRAPPGKRVHKVHERPPKYQFDEFDSDSDDEGNRKGPISPSKRTSASRYRPNDKFMVRVSKSGKSDKPIGLGMLEHKGEIYVSRIERNGLFYSTPIAQGDMVLSVNGRKVGTLKSVAEIVGMIEEKDSINIFVLRPDPNDRNVKEAISMFF